jgi:hypothetical protein
MHELVRTEAAAVNADIEAGGKTYRAEDVHTWLDRLAIRHQRELAYPLQVNPECWGSPRSPQPNQLSLNTKPSLLQMRLSHLWVVAQVR